MKIIASFLCTILIVSCANGKESDYTGSTPAGTFVKLFLGIPLSDSVDFIRWQLKLAGNQYTLNCNYGIGKPNTNGFIAGKQISLSGALRKEKNNYQLQNGIKVLHLVELNNDLLHLLDAYNHLLVGNGGWSYTLNNLAPSVTDQVNINSIQTPLKDSMIYEGRTPCNVPGIIPAGMQCYKLKWQIVLYSNTANNTPSAYRVYGTPYRKEGGKTGNWKIIEGKNGRIIYQLDNDDGNVLLYLLKLDEHILIFTDTDGKLLAGNEDFSYTINKVH
ncbi:hypothetical protein BH10BAC2_BH10BAC2_38960 [soil metagenome]